MRVAAKPSKITPSTKGYSVVVRPTDLTQFIILSTGSRSDDADDSRSRSDDADDSRSRSDDADDSKSRSDDAIIVGERRRLKES